MSLFFFFLKIKKAKQMLNSNVIRVKRYDLLDAENQKKAINLEETRLIDFH